MWRKLWRWLKQIYHSLQQRFQKPEPPPPPRLIPDIERETKFMQTPVVEVEETGEVQEKDEAEELYQRGKEQFYRGNFTDALASWNEAIRLKRDYPDAYYLRGVAQGQLGQKEDAIASFNEAIHFKRDFPDAYYNRGVAQGQLGQNKDAIASFNEAICLKPNFPDAYYNRGVVQGQLGQKEDAIASFNEAICLKPNFSDAYYLRGLTQSQLGQYEDAIASFNEAIRLKPDFPDAYFHRGIVLCDHLKQYEDAIASFNEAIRFKSDFDTAYCNRGVAQRNLGQYEDAIASFNEAIRLKPDFSYAYFKRGVAQSKLRQYEDAIASFDSGLTLKRDAWQDWGNRGDAAGMLHRRNSPYLPSAFAILNPDLNERGFKGAMASYEEGLKYCPKDTHPEGWGMLHFDIANAYYNRSRKNPKTRYQDRQTAHTHYNLALETLTETAYPEAHLKVLRRLIRLLLGWNQTEQAQELKRRGTDVLRRLVEECTSPRKQRKLTLEFADFNQLTVDLWVQQGDVVQALEVAEAGKNACLSWLLDGRGDAVAEPSWQQIRKLLQGQTAVVYWHLSPYALTTFILKPDEDEPRVLRQSRFQDQSGYLGNLQELETWIEEWNQAYSRDKGNKTSAQSASWRKSLPQQLDRLSEILQISAILEELNHCQGYHRLILIPHKDLHRLPLHALFLNQDGFAESCAITYLPSAVFGLSLLDAAPSPEAQSLLSMGHEEPPQPPLAKGGLFSIGEEPPQPPLAKGGLFSSILSIENPKSLIKDRDGSHKPLAPLPAADIESEMISRLFPTSTRFAETEATTPAVKTALEQGHHVLHFTGHGYYEFADPVASALFLSGDDVLTVQDIIQLNLSSYHLIYLSACETAVTGNPTITSEYVGLTSGFLRSGVGSVLSTLWQVQSDASTLFALYFYQQLQQGHSYPVAFTATQKWLKSVTKADLSQWYQQQIEKLEQQPELSDGDIRCLNYFEGCRNGLAIIKENTPFSDPYHWSPFTLYGL
ncbi:CHAT domain-containing protein [Oscillatoria acuminata]|uniref:Tetratricopeptide repeat protein n=1 Tax=Oscillatoria acuminata PCC 6304 TaxID=56110 RepID=K9TAH9_9CYAN|nr:CHAT domain-containing tetratricopeptide repeat protein [Oscillatoria acuminata]AFY79877.1 tetratricopeptide repeat protein [Oscillatoria acuminata PCC 6304]